MLKVHSPELSSLFYCFEFFETGSHCAPLVDLGLMMQTKLASDLQQFSGPCPCFCFLSVGMEGICHYASPNTLHKGTSIQFQNQMQGPELAIMILDSGSTSSEKVSPSQAQLLSPTSTKR